jgi:hypothetical protein
VAAIETAAVTGAKEMKKKDRGDLDQQIWLSADPANTDCGDMGFWWNRGCNSIAAVSVDETGLRFDGGDFTVIIDNPGQTNESVKVLVNDVVVFGSVKAKAS